MKLNLRKILTVTLWLLAVFSLMTVNVSCFTKKTTSTETSSTSQESSTSSTPQVLEFYADWWPSCRQVAPVVNRLKEEYRGKVEIIQVNVDDTKNAELTAKYSINAIPTFIFLDKSGNVVDKAVGALAETELREKIDQLQ